MGPTGFRGLHMDFTPDMPHPKGQDTRHLEPSFPVQTSLQESDPGIPSQLSPKLAKVHRPLSWIAAPEMWSPWHVLKAPYHVGRGQGRRKKSGLFHFHSLSSTHKYQGHTCWKYECLSKDSLLNKKTSNFTFISHDLTPRYKGKYVFKQGLHWKTIHLRDRLVS